MTPTMLIVDDEPRIFQALRRTLHRENLQLLHAGSGEEAVTLLEAGPVDIVLADENMPGMPGSRLLGIVRQRWPETVRMLLTGTARLDVVVKAVNLGHIRHFFTKPCDDAELIVAIREALQERDAARLALATAGTHGSTATGAHSRTGGTTTDSDEDGAPVIRLDGGSDDEDDVSDVDALLHDIKRSLDDLA